MARMRILAPLRYANFRSLFVGSTVSNLGDWLDQIALLVLVSVVWHRGPLGLAAISVAMLLPTVIGPFIGVLVDRVPAKRAMIVTDIVRAVLTVGLVFTGSLWVAVALLFCRSALGTGFNAAAQRVIRHSAPPEQLVAANSLDNGIAQAMKIAGPALGGFLVAVFDPHDIFAINAVSFIISAIALSFLKLPSDQPAPAGSRPSYRHELAEGIRFVARTRVLYLTAAVMGVLMFVVFMYDSMSPLAVLGLGLDKSAIGYMVGCVGVGGLIGALVVAQLFKGNRPFVLMGASVTAIGVLVALLGLGIVQDTDLGLLPWLGVTLVLGIATAGILIPFPYMIQMSTPDRLMGRAWTTMGSITGILNMLAPVAGAALVTWAGVGNVFFIAGLILVGYGVLVAGTLAGLAPSRPADADGAPADTPADPGASTSEPVTPLSPIQVGPTVAESLEEAEILAHTADPDRPAGR